jgi:hypothetical protein
VHQHLAALERKGWLVRDGAPRGIALVSISAKPHGEANARISGIVRRGRLVQLSEHRIAMATLPIAITKPNLSLVRAADDALVPHGIKANDLLLVDRSRRKARRAREQGVSLNGEKGLILAIIRPL